MPVLASLKQHCLLPKTIWTELIVACKRLLDLTALNVVIETPRSATMKDPGRQEADLHSVLSQTFSDAGKVIAFMVDWLFTETLGSCVTVHVSLVNVDPLGVDYDQDFED